MIVRIVSITMLLQNLPVLNPHESANLQIYRALRQAIVNCSLLPGEPISDKEISEAFGVSRQPVRDAFIKLSGAGLIQVLPQRGTFVMKISPKRVENGRFIREAIEVAVAGRAADSVTDDQLQWLQDNLEQQRHAADHNDTAEFLTLDDEFHGGLARMIDCTDAWVLIEDIKAHMDRVRYLSLAEITPLPMLIVQHAAILDGLDRHDANIAQEAMRLHLREINMSFGPIHARNPGWFDTE